MTPGMKTSEFFLTLAVVICATVLAFAGHISDSQWMTVAMGSAAGYGISRGLAKRDVGR